MPQSKVPKQLLTWLQLFTEKKLLFKGDSLSNAASMMGQQQSSFVVEVASSRYGKFQSLSQKDPDEDASQQWRITVNPASEFAATEQLKALINRLYHSQKLLCSADTRQILTALNYLDVTQGLLLPLLTVVSNSTAFAGNQILLRESGVVARLVELFCDKDHDWPKSCRIMLLQCIANMAVDVTNEPILKRGIGAIVRRMDSSVELECVVALQALTNLSLNISPSHITTFLPAIPHCMNKLWVKGEVNLHSLRLLVNLSCCPDIVPHILASKAVTGLLSILDTDKEDVLLKAVTWLLCMSCAVETLGIDYKQIAPLNQDPFGNTNFTLYHALYGMKAKPELENKVRKLAECKNTEIANKSVRLLDILLQITPMRTSSASLSRLVS